MTPITHISIVLKTVCWDLEREREKLNQMDLNDPNILQQSQLVDKLIVQVMKGGETMGRKRKRLTTNDQRVSIHQEFKRAEKKLRQWQREIGHLKPPLQGFAKEVR